MAARKPAKSAEGILNRELRGLLAGALAGAIGLPVLIWIVGRTMFGPYGNGGLFALWADFARQLVQGSLAAWIVLASPYGLWLGWRLLSATRRRLS